MDGLLTPAEAQAMQDDAKMRDQWIVWCVTATDLEHPGRLTARAHLADRHGGTVLPGALAADMLDALRAMLPAGLTRHDRTSVDPLDVIELWD